MFNTCFVWCLLWKKIRIRILLFENSAPAGYGSRTLKFRVQWRRKCSRRATCWLVATRTRCWRTWSTSCRRSTRTRSSWSWMMRPCSLPSGAPFPGMHRQPVEDILFSTGGWYGDSKSKSRCPRSYSLELHYSRFRRGSIWCQIVRSYRVVLGTPDGKRRHTWTVNIFILKRIIYTEASEEGAGDKQRPNSSHEPAPARLPLFQWKHYMMYIYRFSSLVTAMSW